MLRILTWSSEAEVPPHPSPVSGLQLSQVRVSSWGAVGSVSAGIIQRL